MLRCWRLRHSRRPSNIESRSSSQRGFRTRLQILPVESEILSHRQETTSGKRQPFGILKWKKHKESGNPFFFSRKPAILSMPTRVWGKSFFLLPHVHGVLVLDVLIHDALVIKVGVAKHAVNAKRRFCDAMGVHPWNHVSGRESLKWLAMKWFHWLTKNQSKKKIQMLKYKGPLRPVPLKQTPKSIYKQHILNPILGGTIIRWISKFSFPNIQSSS